MIRVVDILITTDEAEQKVLGSVVFDGEKIVGTGYVRNLMKEFEEEGIVGKGGKVYYPADGIKFLENLRFAFTGSHVRATGVKYS